LRNLDIEFAAKCKCLDGVSLEKVESTASRQLRPETGRVIFFALEVTWRRQAFLGRPKLLITIRNLAKSVQQLPGQHEFPPVPCTCTRSWSETLQERT
jgi:hypothetical protein